jgi:sterol desaturase/sphingolipid hydroxylase (fatty acid hydroxylase superfamily)
VVCADVVAEIFGFRVGRLTSMFYSNPIAYHSMHHARYDRHYGFGTSIMDFTFGTEWPDWPAVHTRALQNQPLKTLSEHADRPK